MPRHKPRVMGLVGFTPLFLAFMENTRSSGEEKPGVGLVKTGAFRPPRHVLPSHGLLPSFERIVAARMSAHRGSPRLSSALVLPAPPNLPVIHPGRELSEQPPASTPRIAPSPPSTAPRPGHPMVEPIHEPIQQLVPSLPSTVPGLPHDDAIRYRSNTLYSGVAKIKRSAAKPQPVSTPATQPSPSPAPSPPSSSLVGEILPGQGSSEAPSVPSISTAPGFLPRRNAALPVSRTLSMLF